MASQKDPLVFGVNCLICNERVDILTHAHMRLKHNITQLEYLTQFPEHCDPTFWGDVIDNKHHDKYKLIAACMRQERKEQELWKPV